MATNDTAGPDFQVAAHRGAEVTSKKSSKRSSGRKSGRSKSKRG